MWLWGAAITAAIRAEDATRPVVSGLHDSARATIESVGEAADILCTHPYPTFTPHCRVDPLDSFRSAFHAAAETCYCRDLGGREAFVEEFGTLGPTITGTDVSCAYLRNVFWNAYAHNCHGALWWCANDQTELPQTPYQWSNMERELGLLRTDGTPKPMLEEFRAFAAFAQENPLPPPRTDAVVILPEKIDEWGVGFMSFLLAKAAGFDVRFQSGERRLQPAPLYILPSARGFGILQKYRLQALLAAVHDGATLLLTADGTLPQPVEPFGLEIETSFQARGPLEVRNDELGLTLSIPRAIQARLKATAAQVLATDLEGRPAFTCATYGKGRLLYLAAPLEAALMDRPDSFGEGAPDFWRPYAIAAEKANLRRIVRRREPLVTMTEHPLTDGGLAVVAVNNATAAKTVPLDIASPWRIERCVGGEWDAATATLSLPAKSGALLYLKH